MAGEGAVEEGSGGEEVGQIEALCDSAFFHEFQVPVPAH